jgi:hypothetical protein
VIDNLARPFLARTVRTTVECAIGLDPMADDLAATMITDRGQFMNRALEAIKYMCRARRDYLE